MALLVEGLVYICESGIEFLSQFVAIEVVESGDGEWRRFLL
jgi:hypothetical protein